MNMDLTALQDLIQQLFVAVKSGNIAAIAGVLIAGYFLYKKLKAAPVAPPATPVTGQKTIDAAMTLLNAEPNTLAEKAMLKAVAEKHA